MKKQMTLDRLLQLEKMKPQAIIDGLWTESYNQEYQSLYDELKKAEEWQNDIYNGDLMVMGKGDYKYRKEVVEELKLYLESSYAGKTYFSRDEVNLIVNKTVESHK